ncbi:hypothetical protein [Streptomyces sp. SYSU K21746]
MTTENCRRDLTAICKAGDSGSLLQVLRDGSFESLAGKDLSHWPDWPTFPVDAAHAAGYELVMLFCRLLGDRHPTPRPDAISGIPEHRGDLPPAVSAAAPPLRRRPPWPVLRTLTDVTFEGCVLVEPTSEARGWSGCPSATVRFGAPTSSRSCSGDPDLRGRRGA